MPDFKEIHFTTATIRTDRITDEIAVLEIEGEFDHSMYIEASSYLDEIFDAVERAVVVDMHRLTFMDSSGIKLLNQLVTRFSLDNVAIYKANDDLMRIISLVALDKKLSFIKTPDELENWSRSFMQAA